jgi:hypothetical protein
MAREYFCAYHSYLENMKRLNDAERGRLFTACLEYSMTGTEPDISGNESIAWDAIRGQIDRDANEYEKRCKSQAKNANKRWHPDASNGNANNAMACDGINGNAKYTNYAKEKENIYNSNLRNSSISRNSSILPDSSIKSEKVSDSGADKPRKTRKAFVPPTLDEIKAYIAEKKYGVDAQKFFDYFAVSGWVDARGNPVLNWKQKIITWNSKSTEQPKETKYDTSSKDYTKSSAGIEIL